jgi:phosphopantetheine adenylyltransferase
MGVYHIVSSGFDPIHEEHIELTKDTNSHGDGIIILLNSDEWLCRKKRKVFRKFATCKAIGEC